MPPTGQTRPLRCFSNSAGSWTLPGRSFARRRTNCWRRMQHWCGSAKLTPRSRPPHCSCSGRRRTHSKASVRHGSGLKPNWLHPVKANQGGVPKQRNWRIRRGPLIPGRAAATEAETAAAGSRPLASAVMTPPGAVSTRGHRRRPAPARLDTVAVRPPLVTAPGRRLQQTCCTKSPSRWVSTLIRWTAAPTAQYHRAAPRAWPSSWRLRRPRGEWTIK
mmetsp:Transcript_5265/g.13617  ORF Transcript_5265/g.13617 Transcript_5265/m.13617 type:complete len:218 (-) Transcript_5265:484-1137(-)